MAVRLGPHDNIHALGGAQVNTSVHFSVYCLVMDDKKGDLLFFHLQSQPVLWYGNYSSSTKLRNVFSSVEFAKRTPRLHDYTWHIGSLFLTLMRMELHLVAVIVHVYSPPLSPKISFVGPGGLPIVLSASPLCMTALCRRCSAKRPHWHAANASPLWHKTRFIDTLFLRSS